MIFKTTKEIGNYGEKIAARYLMRHGYIIRERNYRAGRYEIDLIAASLFTVAFVEVKTRTYRPEEIGVLSAPSAAVDADKKRFTRIAARNYLHEHPTGKKRRMDVIEVWLSDTPVNGRPKLIKIRHFKGAY